MKVIKHEHACLELQESGKTLMIDPGAYTPLLEHTSNVVGIVITHEHPDHWTAEQLRQILSTSPDARIFAPAGVAAAASDFPIEIMSAGDTVDVDGFTCTFYGGKHASVHPTLPTVDNLGVLVNDTLYYTGDSFSAPDVAIDTLAVTSGAPWLKIGEVMDFITELKPRRTFPTHELVLSAAGIRLANARIKESTESIGGEFFPLEPGQSIEI